MSFNTARCKKITASVSILAALAFASIPRAYATAPAGGTDSSSLLAAIAQYTNGTLTAVTSTSNPVVQAITTALTNLTSPDNATDPATPTPTMQNSFTTYVSEAAASTAAQTTSHAQMVNTVFGTFTTTTVPYANDLAFPSLFGNTTSIFNPDPRVPQGSQPSFDSGLNYLGYAAGLSISHAVPSTNWQGRPDAQKAYTNYFNTITAVESYNAYVLSQLYEDAKQGVPTIQKTLVNQASDPANWFAIITNETIGAVLRQTLMYQSQSYILLTQILQTEKMILAGHAMNNTMSMLSNSVSETMLVNKAVSR